MTIHYLQRGAGSICRPVFFFVAVLFVAALVSGTGRADEPKGQPEATAVQAPAAQAPADQAPSAESPPTRKGTKSKPTPDNPYIRIVKGEDKKPLALETSVIRFEGREGTKYAGRIVDLVGVIHIGQAGYYEELDGRLKSYDAVLYELVAPDGTRIRPEDLEKRRSVLASVQSGMKEMLDLEYQLEKIDYLAKNFVHADMSPEEFSKDMANRGDGIWKMAARMVGAGLATQNATGSDIGLIAALISGDRTMGLRQSMAKQLVSMNMAGIDDATGDNTLIKGRNRKALQILERELAAGKKTVAIFYGAGHMEDMAARVEKDFEMSQTQVQWVKAWDLKR
ncbi:MAG: hypothetical protein RI963_2138 [Planctomycetota bacterium]|jgi:hypothetical protein